MKITVPFGLLLALLGSLYLYRFSTIFSFNQDLSPALCQIDQIDQTEIKDVLCKDCLSLKYHQCFSGIHFVKVIPLNQEFQRDQNYISTYILNTTFSEQKWLGEVLFCLDDSKDICIQEQYKKSIGWSGKCLFSKTHPDQVVFFQI